MIKIKSIGELIEYVDQRNHDESVLRFYGININKEFMPTAANVDSVDPKKYKIVNKNQFVFSGMQTGRDKTIRIGLFTEESPIIVSPAYTTFQIKSEAPIIPEYFFMLFLSNEIDRYGWFISDSSVRANLDLERFEEITFELPPLDIQKKYVKLYKAIFRVQELKVKIKDICPVLIRKSIQEAKVNEKI